LKVTETVDVGGTLVAPLAGVVLVTVGGESTVNEKVELALIGVPAETSVTWLATTVAVHTAPAGRFADGVSVKLVAPPGGAGPIVNASGVPVGHCSVKADAVTFTALLKLTVMVADASTAVAPLAGVVEVTVGGESVVNEAVTLAAR
jgi:hypothetical protein